MLLYRNRSCPEPRQRRLRVVRSIRPVVEWFESAPDPWLVHGGFAEAAHRLAADHHDPVCFVLRRRVRHPHPFGWIREHSPRTRAIELDPELAWGEDDRFSEWSDALGRELFPLGVLDRGRFFLGIDERSEIYLVEGWVASFGAMPHAFENLILGVRPRRIDEGHR